ncbi:DUF2971 domain-containing protein [Streptococcus salivarius]
MNDEQIKNLNKKIQKCVKQIEGIINNTNTSDLTELNDSVIKVYGIYQRFPNSEDLAGYYMSILKKLAERNRECMLTLSLLEAPKVNEFFLEILQDSASKASRIYQHFPNSEDLASYYMSILEFLATSQKDLESLQDSASKASRIYQRFPNSEDLAGYYMSILVVLAISQEDLESLQDSVSKASRIYQRFPNSEDLAGYYMSILAVLAISQEDLETLQDSVSKASRIYQHFPNSEDLAGYYMSILAVLAISQEDLESLQDSVSKASGIYQRFPNSEDLASYYMSILAVLAIKQEDLESLQDSVSKASRIYQRFPNSEGLAGYYMSILEFLVTNQEDLESLQDSVSKASRIYQRFPNSEVFAGCYMSILDILTMSQEDLETLDLETLQDCVFEANSICQSFPNSEYLASYYIYFLFLLVKKQKSIEESKVTIMLAMELYNRFPNLKNLKKIQWIFVFFISNYINFFLLNSHNEEKKKSLVNLEVLFDCMSNASAELIKDIIDRMFYPNYHLINLTDENAKIISQILCRFGRTASLKHTQYGVLMGLLIDLENTDNQLEPLIKIYYLVQTIKYQLTIKDLSNINFGHYTSGEVLQNILKQECNLSEDGYSIKGRTRLGNVKYMNDPEEGRILDKYLKPREISDLEVSLKPSPWFLMSLTTAIDDLAMWSQYGYRAEGVCLLFEEDSFAAAYSVVDTDWFTRKNDIPVFERNLKLTDEDINSSYKKDFLYRICYLDEESLKEGELHVVKKNNNNMLENSEIEQINSCLKQIKSILSKIEKKTLLYSAVEECLEEIRYLFKASGYSYEAELRILKYADLSPDNNKIKIDNSGPVAKLYLERDMPIQLKQVIFGPKFSNPEHVTPLIYLLDKNIEFKRSERKFK